MASLAQSAIQCSRFLTCDEAAKIPSAACSARLAAPSACESKSWQSAPLRSNAFAPSKRVLDVSDRRLYSSNNAVASSQLNSTEFAEQEAAKFRDEIGGLLQKEGVEVADVSKVAEICSEVIREYALSYAGELDPTPFEKMKEGLEKAGVPTEQVLLAAIGWARANLYSDWKKVAK
eukprot:TRINITY_DN36129_c0_g1_i1.p1 TRINITY_DN36129_c0_g1~~TRINITY_DN36129_c0_g1_i1.p1  ORF type:complete len:176 (+),score=29.19 TRINITY_DN36129_c0_g1_i1:148-675(+)